jgi:uncharacterized protein YkwD
MAKRREVGHVLEGKNVLDRVRAAGYKDALVGENVGKGFKNTVEEIFTQWMNSDAHRGNILHKGFTEIGLGIVPDEAGDLYFTQVFGKSKGK